MADLREKLDKQGESDLNSLLKRNRWTEGETARRDRERKRNGKEGERSYKGKRKINTQTKRIEKWRCKICVPILTHTHTQRYIFQK